MIDANTLKPGGPLSLRVKRRARFIAATADLSARSRKPSSSVESQPGRVKKKKTRELFFFRKFQCHPHPSNFTTKTERVPIRALPMVRRGRRCAVGGLPLCLPASVVSQQPARMYGLLGA